MEEKRREGRPPGRRAEPRENEPDPCTRSLALGHGKLLKVRAMEELWGEIHLAVVCTVDVRGEMGQMGVM